MVNQLVRQVQKSIKLGICIPRLYLESVGTTVYIEASLANNPDLSSQIGRMNALTEKYGNGILLEFSSKKCRRITHSSLADEVMVFAAGFDTAFIIQHHLEDIIKRWYPI